MRGADLAPDPAVLRFAYLIEPPFCFRTPDGRVTGADVELARLLAQRLNLEPFQPIEATFEQLLPGLARGDWDMTTGLFVTAERARVALFSRSIWSLPDGLLVRREDAARIGGYRSLAAQPLRLAVITAQIQHDTALRLDVPPERIRTFADYETAAQAVLSGEADAYASVALAHRGYLQQRADLALAVVDVPLQEKPAEVGAFAFARSNAALAAAVDEELARVLGTPEHRAILDAFGLPAR